MIIYRKADVSDFDAIHRLNYETFVEEIPQHPPNPERRLVDRFHGENTYWIGEANGEVVAMCALREERPFSLEQKGVSIPEGEWLEIRLLAVKKAYRRNRTFAGLMRAVIEDATEREVDGIVISGTTREQVLYHRFGFVPFADPIGPKEARYVPMMLTRTAFYESKSATALRPKSLLAGPVECSERVRERLSRQPRPHRSKETSQLLESVQQKLADRVGLPHVYTMLGSGTVANDAIASRLSGHGAIFNTGEFGERLIDHARRAGLSFDVISVDRNGKWDVPQVERILPKWIWTVHCETSLGMLVDLEPLRTWQGTIAIDAISAVGTFDYDYSFADYVTFSSNKALRNAPGLAFVAMKQPAVASSHVPRYFDLTLYKPIAFTQSEPLLSAMDVALDELTNEEVASHQEKMTALLKSLRESGLQVDVSPAQSPGIITLHMPPGQSATELGRQLSYQGYLVQYESDYLKRANVIQVSTMGWTTCRMMRDVGTYIAQWMRQKNATPRSGGPIIRENLDVPSDELFVRGVSN
ncbi:GNAT family N-acetyltransferase [Exiguobacterium qingdaonense]|uniref:GNAT family N-acetyltransferase n=1 Tax=Exiguobacterium qingdaonense TaxID=2751251 RepID=UPI001BECEF37|nr:GNAT family N-acetyltransferase [Exiguobacterium qingdaonense]